MAEFSKELKEKLVHAKTMDDVKQILQEHSEDVTLTEPLWKEIEHMRQTVSLDELEAVTGGKDRDFIKDGCAATVEPGSSCWGTDACDYLNVSYDNKPTVLKCPDCGGVLCYWDNVVIHWIVCNRYNCSKCGGFFQADPDDVKKLIRLR